MPLLPTLSACITTACRKLSIPDTTGLYESTNNTGGWGTPNISPSDVDSAIITITLPGSDTEYSFDITAILQSTTLPTSYLPGYTIDPFDLDYSDFGVSSTDKFPDGNYTITYTIVADEVEYTCTIYFYSFCNVCCCVNKMLTKALDKVAWNKCDSKSVEDALFARALLLKGQQFAASYWDFDKAEQIRKQAEKLCDFDDCSCH